MVDVIEKKRDGLELTKEEIEYVISGYTKGEIPDYQMAAFAMAVVFTGMSRRETADLTMAIVRSGETVDLRAIPGKKVDKHSTGGVGDKTTLIVAPLVACAGVPVAKMSGRGLGHTGGTIDKLEAIPGFRTELSRAEMIRLVNENGMALAGQSGNLTPADKKLYSLRDVTGTVNSIPLIASSVMSKKIASGSDAIVLDVKVGSGAFMNTIEKARSLAETMVEIGERLGKKTIALLTNMDEPLGRTVGNALEVREAIEILQGGGDRSLRELSLTLAAYMTVAAGKYSDFQTAKGLLSELLDSGKAFDVFRRFVSAQGGDPSVCDRPERLAKAATTIDVTAQSDGYVTALDARMCGVAAMLLGAGRQTKEDQIDHSVGLVFHKKVGDSVKKGERIVTVHAGEKNAEESIKLLKKAVTLRPDPQKPKPIVFDVITARADTE